MKCRALPAMKQGCLLKERTIISLSRIKKSWDDNNTPMDNRDGRTNEWISQSNSDEAKLARHTDTCQQFDDKTWAHGRTHHYVLNDYSYKCGHTRWVTNYHTSPDPKKKQPLRMSRFVGVFVIYIIIKPTLLSLSRVIYDYAIRVSSGTLICKHTGSPKRGS